MPLLYDWLQQNLEGGGAGNTAIVYRDTYLSWRGLAHRVDRRAQELASMGIGAGAWVGVMLGNVPELAILALAVSKLGGVFVPLDPTTSARDLDMVLEAAPLRALITRPHGGDSPAATPPSATRAEGGRRAGARFAAEARRRLQGTLLTVHMFRRDATELADDARPATVLFTADAGGDPKGVVRSEAQLAALAEAVGAALDLAPEERVLGAAPLYHSYGFDFGLLAPLRRRASMYLEDEVSSKRVTKLLRDEKIDVFPGSPALFGTLAREVVVKPLTVKKARFVSSGSALAGAVAEAFHERFRVRLLSAYHVTETGAVALDRTGKEPGTVGKPLEGVEVRLGDGGNGLGPRPLWVRSPGGSDVFVPELKMPARSGSVPIGRADHEGWFRTGDLGYFDKGGRLVLAGREDDVVKVDGKRVALGEVAGCLESFAKVKAAEARVVVDDFTGSIVVARVVVAGVCRAEELIDHCARHLAPYKVPRQIEFCDKL
jgi:acyl-coenzyme A synthetase/AMP-(fatty) acid ligase